MEAGKSFLTFKGPVQPSPRSCARSSRPSSPTAPCLRILEELGFHVWFRYQKYREEFALDDCIIAIDETPVGVFVEIEGGERGIAETARRSAAGPADYLLDSYRGLFVRTASSAACRRRTCCSTPSRRVSMITHALVLTAGLGTRLRPLTLTRAKPAIARRRRADRPPHLRGSRAGCHRLVLNLHHLPETIAALVGDGSDLGVRVRYSWEQPECSAAPAVRVRRCRSSARHLLHRQRRHADRSRSRQMAEAHQTSGALVTLALVPNREPERYGGVSLTRRQLHRVRAGRRRAGLVSLHRRAGGCTRKCSRLEGGRSLSSAASTTRSPRPSGQRSRLLCEAGFWDIGTPEDYWGRPMRFSAFVRRNTGDSAGAHARISGRSAVTRSILWDDVEVLGRALVHECIVTDGVFFFFFFFFFF